METFLSFIFITILVVYLAGIIGRWLLRRWISRKQREFARRFGEPGGFRQYTWTSDAGYRDTRSQPREGEIKVQKTAPLEKKVSTQVGDYVDYEEVDPGDDCPTGR